MTRSSKHQHVQRSLEEAIRSGEFGPGEQIPSEVDLAQRWGVSYMTARKAVAELVAADVLERRASKGTFVRRAGHVKVTATTLHLVVAAYEGAGPKDFIFRGVTSAKHRGWNANIIRLTHQQQDPAVRAVRAGDPALIMLDDIPRGSALWLAMKAARGKAVSFHTELAADGIPTVYSDAKRDLELAVEHLHGLGHTGIAMAVQMSSRDEDAEEMVAWQRSAIYSVAGQSHPVAMLRIDSPLFESPMRACYETIKRYLATATAATAIIAKSDELAIAALAACHDMGLSVPGDISILALGNWHTMEFIRPALTCIDFNFAGQFGHALDIVDEAMRGEAVDPLLRIADGFLVERGSTGPARPRRAQP
jgi:DNA-binding LacI/PurR family transcriptional regulator